MHKKTIFITGSSRGIGKAIALRFATEGYHVFINCKTSIKELEAVASQIESIPNASVSMLIGDVGEASTVKQLAKELYTQCDHLDILINNAGIAYTGLITDMSDEAWSKIMRTNLDSLFYCSKALLPAMISRKQGKILNISSIWGLAGASYEVAYSTTKSGVNGFTKALAKELAPSNIQVNALACGVIDTIMNRNLSSTEAASLADDIPLGRFGTPEEVADMVLNLALAPAYLTGQILTLDGGYL